MPFPSACVIPPPAALGRLISLSPRSGLQCYAPPPGLLILGLLLFCSFMSPALNERLHRVAEFMILIFVPLVHLQQVSDPGFSLFSGGGWVLLVVDNRSMLGRAWFRLAQHFSAAISQVQRPSLKRGRAVGYSGLHSTSFFRQPWCDGAAGQLLDWRL